MPLMHGYIARRGRSQCCGHGNEEKRQVLSAHDELQCVLSREEVRFLTKSFGNLQSNLYKLEKNCLAPHQVQHQGSHGAVRCAEFHHQQLQDS